MSTLRSFISATVRGLLIGAAFIAPISSFGVEQFKESSSGTSFDKSTAFTHNGKTFKLDATGAALRRKWFVKGYVIGHYIENPVIGTQEEVLEDIFSKFYQFLIPLLNVIGYVNVRPLRLYIASSPIKNYLI